MITSTLKIVTNPGNRTEILRTLTAILGRSKVQPGCSASHLLEDIEERNVIFMVQEWGTKEDLTEHLRSDDYRRVLATIELSDSPPEFHFDELSSRRGMEVVESVRLRKGLALT